MADNNQQQPRAQQPNAPQQRPPGARMTVVARFIDQDPPELRVTTWRNNKPVPGVALAIVAVNDIPVIADDLYTDGEGVKDIILPFIPDFTKPIKVLVLAESGEKFEHVWTEGIPYASRKIVFQRPETTKVRENVFKTMLGMKHEVTGYAASGDVLFAPSHTMRITRQNGEASIIHERETLVVSIGERGEVFLFEYEGDGHCEVDIYLLGFPGVRDQITIPGPKPRPIVAKPDSPAIVRLFAGCV